jgi:DNA-directed RNA polymerase beta' subunit
MGQVAVPEEMARILSVPVRVTDFNIQFLQNMVNQGLVDSLLKPNGKTRINLARFRRGTRLKGGDVVIRGDERIPVVTGKELVQAGDSVERDGKLLDKEKIIPANRSYNLENGWIVERPVLDGDIVLINRQPTLHRGSMNAMEVLVKPGKTIRVNLGVVSAMNMDFDGDEVNIHIPQSLEAMAELRMLSAAKHNIISAQCSKPVMGIIQDSLLGSYKMTNGIQPIDKGRFFDIMIKLELMETVQDRIQHVRRVLKNNGKKVQCFNGKGIFSMFLPKDFNYRFRNDCSEEEPEVIIKQGVLLEGTLNKAVLGTTHTSLIRIIHKEYGADACAHFMDCVHFSANAWNLLHVFTIGLGDCMVSDTESKENIQSAVDRCYIEAEGIKTTTNHPGIRELRINASLSKAKDIGLRIAKEALKENNNFLSTVRSGSKGDFFNIAQITGILGQQNLKGQRIPLILNHGKRSLPHYPYKNITPEMEYESRGFISNSFIHGLNPREFFFHAMSGRESISDTALGTATSGYMQRRIIKLTEDIKIQNDGTVRDVVGNLYQPAYGETGFDPCQTVKIKGNQEACDISRLVDKLNTQYEATKKGRPKKTKK